jgi:hypothetical protein
MANIVPFGKYKGQPIELLANDKQYVDWALSQDGIRKRYPDFVKIVINNFQEPSETPDHNAMQVKFLNDSYAKKFANVVFNITDELISDLRVNIINEMVKNKQKDEHKIITHMERERLFDEKCHGIPSDLSWHKRHVLETPIRDGIKKDISLKIDNIYKNIESTMQINPVISNVRFETKQGLDVEYKHYLQPEYMDMGWIRAYNRSWHLRIEIKPSVSDNFPAIFRQIRLSGANILLLSEYTGVGATRDEFIKYFATNNVKVVFSEDIDNV